MTTSNLPTKAPKAPSGPQAAVLDADQDQSQSITAALQFNEALPLMLVSTLERRYLSGFRPGDWRIEPREGDTARPVLRAVEALGRPDQRTEWARSMPHVLTACHDNGHALVMALHGQGERHRLYLGGRRLIGAGGGSTQDYMASQESAFKAYFNGLRTGPVAGLDSEGLPEMSTLLQTAPVMAAVTGIPSGRGKSLALDLQSLDRLVRAVGNQRYVLMVVAEPIDPFEIDATLDACRRLKGEIHAYTNRTVSRMTGQNSSTSHREKDPTTAKSLDKPMILYGAAIFMGLAGAFVPGMDGLMKLMQPTSSMAMMANMRDGREGDATARQVSDGTSTSDSSSVNLLNANAEACEQLLQQHIQRLQAGRSGGWWRTAVYVAAENVAALESVTGALRSLCSGDESALDPMRVVPLPAYLGRGAIEQGQILSLHPGASDQGHPLGPSYDALATPLTSDELAVLVNLPREEIPGLPMRDIADFALSVPPPTADSIALGVLQDGVGRDLEEVTVTSAALNRHVFVTGITGCGKTNTCMQLLLESYIKLKIPFLVVEPAKQEYRRLAQVPELKGKLRVYTVGGDSPLPFRLNPLSPAPGVPLGRHIDLFKAVCNASFPAFAGLSYVLEEAILDVYTARGWSLYTSDNPFLGARPSMDDESALTPCLDDLYQQVDVVMKRKGYGGDILQNMGAALRSRLRSLMINNKGLMLNTRRSTPLKSLFEGPTVIELKELSDDEEKAFVMALLFALLYEYAEQRQEGKTVEARGRLQHLTLIEEAHRLLAATKGAAADSGDSRGKAVSMFTDMLAEMRAYGEGFLIADQIPTKLAPETLKNSSLKIVHRLVSPDDRYAAGSCINLSEQQMRHLNNLTTGHAIVHDERIGEAVLTHIYPSKDTRAPDLTAANLRALGTAGDAWDRKYLQRHAGCHECPTPCTFLYRLQQAKDQATFDAALRPFLDGLLLDDADAPEGVTAAWQQWTRWRGPWDNRAAAMAGTQGQARLGTTYCAATQAAYEWLGRVLAARALTVGGTGELEPGERLQRERAAASLARLFWLWTGKSALDDEARQTFERARAQVREIVAGAPPQELPGCGACPVRCRALPFVAPVLGELQKKVGAKLAMPGALSAGTQRVSLTPIVEATIPVLANRLVHAAEPTLTDDLLYCTVVNTALPAAAEANRTALLDLLRQRPDEE